MIKVLCDKCGADCDRVAFDVRIGILYNPTPMYIKDLGEPHITDDQTHGLEKGYQAGKTDGLKAAAETCAGTGWKEDDNG